MRRRSRPESNGLHGHRYGVYGVEMVTGQTRAHFVSGDAGIANPAWCRNRLWIMSGPGVVYGIDPARIRPDGRMEDGVVHRFRGSYRQLFARGDDLWAISVSGKHLYRLNLK